MACRQTHLLHGPWCCYSVSRFYHNQVVEPQRLTLEELATFNGTEAGKPIYLAIRGVVFNVTSGARPPSIAVHGVCWRMLPG